jgi:hypothetical protein
MGLSVGERVNPMNPDAPDGSILLELTKNRKIDHWYFVRAKSLREASRASGTWVESASATKAVLISKTLFRHYRPAGLRFPQKEGQGLKLRCESCV